MADNIFQSQVQNPFIQSIEGAARGFALGNQIRSIQEQRAAAQAEALRQQDIATRVSRLRQNPNPQWADYEEVISVLPKDQAEIFRKNYESRSTAQQDASKKFVGQVSAALSSPSKDSQNMAISMLRRRATAEREAGNTQEADALELHAKTAETNPKAVVDEMMIIGGATFGKDWADSVLKVREAPERMDIARDELKIKKLEADLKRESNALQRQKRQQDLDLAIGERNQKVAERGAEARNVLADMDNVLNTADRLLGNWGKDKSGKVDPTKPNSTVRSATGPIESRLPTLSSDTADFEALVESMESQAFLSQVNKMRGLGALTEREGGRLTSALGSLRLSQSPEQLGRNIMEIQRLVLKGRDEMEKKYGVSQAPDRPAGPGGAAPAQAPSAMGQAVDRAVAPAAMPSGFRVLGRE